MLLQGVAPRPPAAKILHPSPLSTTSLPSGQVGVTYSTTLLLRENAPSSVDYDQRHFAGRLMLNAPDRRNHGHADCNSKHPGSDFSGGRIPATRHNRKRLI